MSLPEAWALRVVCCFGCALAKAKHETTPPPLSQDVTTSHNISETSVFQISGLSRRNSTDLGHRHRPRWCYWLEPWHGSGGLRPQMFPKAIGDWVIAAECCWYVVFDIWWSDLKVVIGHPWPRCYKPLVFFNDCFFFLAIWVQYCSACALHAVAVGCYCCDVTLGLWTE